MYCINLIGVSITNEYVAYISQSHAALTYIEGGSDPAERLGADEVGEEEDGGGEERGRGGRHEGREGEPQVGGVLGPVPQQQELRDQAQNLGGGEEIRKSRMQCCQRSQR